MWTYGCRAQEPRPNVLLIVADDLGYRDLGCYDSPYIRTPAIDALAAQGARCTRYYAGGCVCSPSRACMLTGRYGIHNGVWTNGRDDLPTDETTIAEVLGAAGYATWYVGKWHAGTGSALQPLDHGFEHFIGTVAATQNHYPPTLVRDRGTTPNTLYDVDRYTAEALSFMASTPEPWFGVVSHHVPHQALAAPAEEIAPYTQAGLPIEAATYAAMVTRMDSGFGQLAAAVPANTLLLFLSDNGASKEGTSAIATAYLGSNLPLRGYKTDLLEGGVRVPAIAVWPGHITPLTVVETAWGGVDLLPTIGEACGTGVGAGLDGGSALELLAGSIPRGLGPRRQFWPSALVEEQWKVLGTALYDVAADPGETTNLAATLPVTAAALRSARDGIYASRVLRAPTNLRLISRTATSVKLGWEHSTGEAGFRIERSADGGATWPVSYTAATDAILKTVSNLAPSTTYRWRVAASDTVGLSAWSNEIEAGTP